MTLDASSPIVPEIDAAITIVPPSGALGGTAGAGSGALGGTTGGTTGGGSLTGGIGGSGGTFDAGLPWGRRDAGTVVVDPGTRDAGAPTSDAAVAAGDGGDYEAVRQVCVDTINMYRGTRGLPPLMRADAQREACSDEGAKYDGELNRGRPANQIEGHKSTMNRSATCRTLGFGAQNACPNWTVGTRTGNPTLADAIKRCLASMWAEGEPPIPVSECIRDQTPGGCFLTHGHWINMTATNSTWVACGFYLVGNGTYWMNQDFNITR